MPDLKFDTLSESEEMYLVTIARLIERGKPSPISLSDLAHELDIQSVSANQMIRKLAQQGFVNYIPYRGVELRDSGRQQAARIIRYRRLWEVFLVDHLRVPVKEAGELACRMEHLTPASISDSLSSFLGNPKLDPKGNVIPSPSQSILECNRYRLSTLNIYQTAQIVNIQDEAVVGAFLEHEGLSVGVEVSILAKGEDGHMLVEAGDHKVSLAKKLTDLIYVNSAVL